MNFEIVSTLIFALAIAHTLLTPKLYAYSLKLKKKRDHTRKYKKKYYFLHEVIEMTSNIQVVFGIWLIPLIVSSIILTDWKSTVTYLETRDYTHAVYITVIVVVIASRPIITFAERIMEWIARLGKDSPSAWWWTLLTIGPLLGALIKEPAAMALTAILLNRKFYHYTPSRPFQYATLGLLFANISVGGMLTTFSSRALFIVASKWEWDAWFMLKTFGWKVVIGLILATGLYHFIFHREFKTFPKELPALEKDEERHPTPLWITAIHLVFFSLIVYTGKYMPIFLGLFLVYLAFWKATLFYQTPLHLKSAILIGFFFASLIIHGELQAWWMVPLMQNLSHFWAMITSFALSAFVDNAIVSYITLDIPQYDDMKHYLVIAGAMSAGALTVIANAPNPVGHAILRPAFKEKISFLGLFLGALPPALIYLTLFWVFR